MEYTPIGNMRHGPFRHHRIIASLVPWDHLVQNTTIGWYAGYHTTSTPYYTVNSSNLITRHIVQGTIIGYLLGAIHVYWIIWWAPAPWPLDTQLSHSLIGWCIKRHQAYQIMFGKKKSTPDHTINSSTMTKSKLSSVQCHRMIHRADPIHPMHISSPF